MQKESIYRYLPIIILMLLAFVSFLIIRPYILTLLSAFVLAYLVRPLAKRFERGVSKSLAAIFTIAITLAIIFIPLGWTITQIVTQSYHAIESGSVDRVINTISGWEIVQKYDIRKEVHNLVSLGIASLSKITFSIITLLISLFILVIAMYYLLVEWDTISNRIQKALPFSNKEHLANEIAKTTNKVVHGTLLIALIEFIVAALGFWIAGVKFFILLATLTALLAFVPGGPGLVWIPLALVKLFSGEYISTGIVILVGAFISIYIDTIVRAKVAGKNARIHPLVALVGILGGASVFGVLGIIIGPLFLSYTIEIIEEILIEYK